MARPAVVVPEPDTQARILRAALAAFAENGFDGARTRVARNPEFVRLMHEEGKRRGPRMRWLVDHPVKPLDETFAKAAVEAHARTVEHLLLGTPPRKTLRRLRTGANSGKQLLEL